MCLFCLFYYFFSLLDSCQWWPVLWHNLIRKVIFLSWWVAVGSKWVRDLTSWTSALILHSAHIKFPFSLYHVFLSWVSQGKADTSHRCEKLSPRQGIPQGANWSWCRRDPHFLLLFLVSQVLRAKICQGFAYLPRYMYLYIHVCMCICVHVFVLAGMCVFVCVCACRCTRT